MMRERASMGRALALVLVVGLGACTYTDSTNVKTGGIWAYYTAEQTDDGQVTVSGSFNVGGPFGTIVTLADGEHIEVNGVAGSSARRVTVDPSADGVYQVDLVRTDGRISSTIQMPAVPTILGLDPPGGVVISPDQLTITWDASEPVDGPNLEVQVDGDCFTGEHALANDTGEYTTGHLSPVGLEGCPIEITLIRKWGGSVNGEFDGGSAQGYRYTHATGQLKPIGG
jgi:hypothetical protein